VSEQRPASQRQLDYLERLGINYDANLTYEEASKLISEATEDDDTGVDQ
jgi:hypothetical protein